MTSSDPSNAVTPEFVENKISDANKRHEILMAGIVIVMFLGFITLLVTVIGIVVEVFKDKEPQVIYNISSDEIRDFKADKILMRVQ